MPISNHWSGWTFRTTRSSPCQIVFLRFPSCYTSTPATTILLVSNFNKTRPPWFGINNIIFADIEVEFMKEAPSLQVVDLTNNPVGPRIHEQLSEITNMNILLTPREKEDWEDLTI